jgi:exopolysaccharide production protein ExoQ
MIKTKARVGEDRLDLWLVYAMLSLTLLSGFQSKDGVDLANSQLNEISWGAAYLIAAWRLVAMRSRLRALLSGSAPLFVFLALCLFSTLWSVEPEVTFKNSLELIGTTIVAVYIVGRLRLAEFLNVLMFFFTASALVSLLLIVASPGRGRMFWGSGSWEGIYAEKNALGAAMAMAIVVFIIYLLRRRVKFKLWASGGLVLCTMLLFGSNSETALLDCMAVLGIGLITIACTSPRYGGVARLAAIVAGALGFAGAAWTGFNSETLYALLGRSNTLTGRADFWPVLVEAIGARPFFGYGYDAFFRSSVSQDYLSFYVVEAGGWSPYHAHNSFLQVCLDTGYAGLCSLLILILAGFIRAIKLYLRERDIVNLWPLLLILFLVLGSYTETYLGSFNTLEWILFVAAFLYPVRTSAASSSGSQPGEKRARPAFAPMRESEIGIGLRG